MIVGLGLSALAWMAFRQVSGLMTIGYLDSAIGRIRAVVSAEEQFIKAHPQVGYTCRFSLLSDGEGVRRLLRNGEDNGYAFEITGCQTLEPQKPNSLYQITARPVHPGMPAFCSDQSGVVKFDNSGSVARCLVNGVPLS